MRNGLSGFCVLLTASVWLGGCGPGTVTALREDPHTTFSFEVAGDYQTVYERIVLRARQQYQRNIIGTRQPGVSASLSTENRSGTVTLWDGGGIGLRYRLTADIRATDAVRTQVDLYAASKRDRQEATLWIVWARTPLEE